MDQFRLKTLTVLMDIEFTCDTSKLAVTEMPPHDQTIVLEIETRSDAAAEFIQERIKRVIQVIGESMAEGSCICPEDTMKKWWGGQNLDYCPQVEEKDRTV